MPTIKEYKHDPGYYIRARPPNMGNINYKIKSTAYPIVEDCGLTHEDEIAWDMIRSLKSLGFIYTDGSGVLDVGEFEPDLNQIEQTSLSEQQAKNLLETIQEHRDLTQDELIRICSILGIDVPKSDLESLERNLNTTIKPLVQTEEFPTSSFIGDVERPQLPVTTWTTDRLDENSVVAIFIEIHRQPFAPTTSGGETVLGNNIPPNTDYLIPASDGVTHNVSISSDEGITDWIVASKGSFSWAMTSEAMRQIGQLLPIVVEELESAGMEPGCPVDFADPVLKGDTN